MENLETPNLETRIKKRKTKSAGGKLVKYVLIAATFTFGGDYVDINNKIMHLAHTTVGIRDASYSANPFDYHITYDINEKKERIAFIENRLTHERNKLYSNGKTEPDDGVLDAIKREIEQAYEWAQDTAVAQKMHEIKESITQKIMGTEDD
jgi:hypothetical protein